MFLLLISTVVMIWPFCVQCHTLFITIYVIVYIVMNNMHVTVGYFEQILMNAHLVLMTATIWQSV